jgi:hypothetical protein
MILSQKKGRQRRGTYQPFGVAHCQERCNEKSLHHKGNNVKSLLSVEPRIHLKSNQTIFNVRCNVLAISHPEPVNDDLKQCITCPTMARTEQFTLSPISDTKIRAKAAGNPDFETVESNAAGPPLLRVRANAARHPIPNSATRIPTARRLPLYLLGPGDLHKIVRRI